MVKLLLRGTLWNALCNNKHDRLIHSNTPHYLISQSTHIKAGEECPPLPVDTLRLYSMKWCPFAQRTRLTLAHKQIRHEEINVNLTEKPNWLLEKNPEGTVPVLELRVSSETNRVQKVLGSLECCEWLDLSYPDTPRVFSKDAINSTEMQAIKAAARDMYGYVSSKVDGEQLSDSLVKVESSLANTLYIAGDQLSIADFMSWPLFERILAKGYRLDSSKYPKLASWVDNMSHLQAVKDVKNSSQGYQKYWASQKLGSLDYDLPS